MYSLHKQIIAGALTGLLAAYSLFPTVDTTPPLIAPVEVILQAPEIKPQALVANSPISDKEWCAQRIKEAADKVAAHQNTQDPRYWKYYAGVVKTCSPHKGQRHAPPQNQNDNHRCVLATTSACAARY